MMLLKQSPIPNLSDVEHARLRLAAGAPAFTLVEPARACVLFDHPQDCLGRTKLTHAGESLIVESAGHARAPLLGHDVQSTELAECFVDRYGGVADDPAFSFGDPEPHPGWNRRDPLPIARNATFERCKLTQFLVDDVRHARVPGGLVGTHEFFRVVCRGRSDQ